MFWGPDKKDLERVRLLLNGETLINKNIDVLEFEKQVKFPGQLDIAHVLFLGDVMPGSISAVNMSRIDKVQLEITTKQASDLYFSALSINARMCVNGMTGLRFN